LKIMPRQGLVILLVVVAFGVLAPLRRGFAFFDPSMIVAYGCLAPLFAAPASAEAFAGAGRLTVREVFARLATIAAYGWGLGLLILCAAILTVNLANWHGRLILPRRTLLIAALLLSLAACFAVATLAALLAQLFSALTAKNILRTGFLLALLMLAFGWRFLPESWSDFLSPLMTADGVVRGALWGAGALAVLAAALLVLLALQQDRTKEANE
jgi:hypothetical protein